MFYNLNINTNWCIYIYLHVIDKDSKTGETKVVESVETPYSEQSGSCLSGQNREQPELEQARHINTSAEKLKRV